MFAARNMLFTRPGYDPAITAFKAASGATDLAANDALARYIRAQGLMSATRCYPMKSAQNAGSGATVHGWGELTANNITLVNSPTWGASGVVLNGTNQCAQADDFLDASTLYVFARVKHASATPTTNQVIVAQRDFTSVNGSWFLALRGDISGDPYRIYRSQDGTENAGKYEMYDTSGPPLDTVNTLVCGFVDGGGRSLWRNKSSLALTLSVGEAQTTRKNSAAKINIGAINNTPAAFAAMDVISVLFVQSSITDAQREAITDLINAL